MDTPTGNIPTVGGDPSDSPDDHADDTTYQDEPTGLLPHFHDWLTEYANQRAPRRTTASALALVMVSVACGGYFVALVSFLFLGLAVERFLLAASVTTAMLLVPPRQMYFRRMERGSSQSRANRKRKRKRRRDRSS